MKKTFLFFLVLFTLIGCANKTKHSTSKFIHIYKSKYDINKSIEIIMKNLAKKNYAKATFFSFNKDALKLKTMLYPTVAVGFNNPKITTTLLQCNPSMAVDLPIKIAFYNDIKGQTFFSFTDSEYWSLKHNVSDKKCLQLLFLIKSDLNEAINQIKDSTRQ